MFADCFVTGNPGKNTFATPSKAAKRVRKDRSNTNAKICLNQQGVDLDFSTCFKSSYGNEFI